MQNPFNPKVQGEMDLKRNNYDLGRSSVFTTEFGQLYPFFLQEVIPGDTAKISGSVGFRGMPTLFPVQTKMRCSMEFYYVRNRTLMDDWEDFIFKTKDIEAPWLRLTSSRAKQMISTGSLGDALGVPTSFASDAGLTVSSDFDVSGGSLVKSIFFTPSGTDSYSSFPRTFEKVKLYVDFYRSYGTVMYLLSLDCTDGLAYAFMTGALTYPLKPYVSKKSRFVVSSKVFSYNNSSFVESYDNAFAFLVDDSYVPCSEVYRCSIVPVFLGDNKCRLDYSFSNSGIFDESLNLSRYHLVIGAYDNEKVDSSYLLDPDGVYFSSSGSSNKLVSSGIVFDIVTPNSVVDATSDTVISSNPFIGNNPSIKLSSLPFRAYEQVTNYYYRFDKNNPYMLDNQAQYNEFIPSHASGPDDNIYDFHYRNWELDRFTSAVQSPQFGEAPLVGLTYNISGQSATLTFSAVDSEGLEVNPTATVGIDEDGDIVNIADFSNNLPSANLRKLQEMVNYGISINDLRVTNSFQRFLENTLRRGLRYRNQLKSHFGVSVDYPDIDVPQYIGGASGIIDTGQVTNMSATGNVGLGDYIGTLQGGVQLEHDINHYCPEHGWIIGICSVSPIPSYPQSINKSLIKTDPFDYFQPEFGKIGFTPIHFSELMPLQTPVDGSVNDVFGYQKAWYDYMQAFDEVHGDFRVDLKDFVLTRTFADRPELSEEFTVIHPDQLNDIFLANNIATPYGSTARWLCRSSIQCEMARPIPMVGTPSLE